MMRCECFADAPYPTILKAEHGMGGGYAGRAGLYRVLPAVRWKTIDGIPAAMDADTGEETVIWTAYPFADVPRYCTSSKSPPVQMQRPAPVPLRISGGEWGSGEPSAGV